MTGERDTPTLGRDGEARETVAAIQELFAEVVGLFHRLRVLAEQFHGQDGMTGGLRGILFELDRAGPRTVPQMARARPVARQHIQGLVDQLRERGLVELEENPAHRRSHLVRLTEAGRALVATMNLRETAFLVGLRMPVPTHEMQTATETLRAVRERLAHSDAERLVADAGTKAMSAKLVKE